MKNSLLVTYIILLLFTIVSTGISSLATAGFITVAIVMIAVLKFAMVGLNFMDLKGAHSFWKVIFLLYGIIIGSIFIILLK